MPPGVRTHDVQGKPYSPEEMAVRQRAYNKARNGQWSQVSEADKRALHQQADQRGGRFVRRESYQTPNGHTRSRVVVEATPEQKALNNLVNSGKATQAEVTQLYQEGFHAGQLLHAKNVYRADLSSEGISNGLIIEHQNGDKTIYDGNGEAHWLYDDADESTADVWVTPERQKQFQSIGLNPDGIESVSKQKVRLPSGDYQSHEVVALDNGNSFIYDGNQVFVQSKGMKDNNEWVQVTLRPGEKIESLAVAYSEDNGNSLTVNTRKADGTVHSQVLLIEPAGPEETTTTTAPTEQRIPLAELVADPYQVQSVGKPSADSRTIVTLRSGDRFQVIDSNNLLVQSDRMNPNEWAEIELATGEQVKNIEITGTPEDPLLFVTTKTDEGQTGWIETLIEEPLEGK